MTHVELRSKRSPVVLSDYVVQAAMKCYVVPIARACNAACLFCATDEYRPEVPIRTMSVGSFTTVLPALAAAGVERFEITGGGEPTLHPHLSELVHQMRRTTTSYIKLYTNGSLLPHNPGVDELNISRCAIAPRTNQSLMKLKSGSPVLSELVENARRRGYRRIRLSVPIINGGVDNIERAIEFVNEAMGLVEAVVFRPLYPATPQRDELVATIDAEVWQARLNSPQVVRTRKLGVEVDVDGCFRSKQLILAPDCHLYSDWSLSRRVEV